MLTDERLSPAVQAERIEAEILAPLRELLAEARDFDAGSDQLDEAHNEAEAALRTSVAKVEVIVEARRQEDATLLARALELRQEEDAHWERWLDELAQLGDDVNG
jgi:hypothetical protein